MYIYRTLLNIGYACLMFIYITVGTYILGFMNVFHIAKHILVAIQMLYGIVPKFEVKTECLYLTKYILDYPSTILDIQK